MTWDTFLDPDLSGRLCLTLLYSLWQVTLLAVAIWGLERLLRPAVEWRYALYVTAMIGGLLALPITYALVDPGTAETAATPRPALDPSQEAMTNATDAMEPANVEPVANVAQTVEFSDPAAGPNNASTETGPETVATRQWWISVTPWVVAFYLAGVLVMLARLAAGIAWAQRLVSRSREITDSALVERFEALLLACRVRGKPLLASAEQVVVPKVLGLLRPTILLPSSALAGLSPGELEMILTHELAHLRRHDMWVNLLQRVAEALLFFNPALWFLSRRISTLREFCCDELTCRLAAQTEPEPRVRYATALLRVAEISSARSNRSALDAGELATLAASGRSPSEMRRRVACLLGEPIQEPIRVSRGGLLAIAASAALLLGGPMVWHSSADTPASPPPESSTDDVGDTPQRADATETADKREESVPITITGRALDDGGRPIEGAEIYLVSREPDYSRLAQTKTNAEGVYRFDDIALPISKPDTVGGRAGGAFEVFGLADGYALAWRPQKAYFPDTPHAEEPNWADIEKYDLPTRFGRDDPINLDITFHPPATIRGRVVDDEGQPIPDTKLAIRYCDPWWDQADYNLFSYLGALDALNEREIVPPRVKTRIAGPDGRFEFTGLPADYRWSIDVRPPGHSPRTIWAVTRAGIDADNTGRRVYSGDFDVVFARPRRMPFRVVYDDSGEPAPKVGVGGLVSQAGFWETTDEDGLCEALLPDGEYELSIAPRYGTPYWRTSANVTVSAETAAEITTLRLRRAAVVDVTVVDAQTRGPLSDVDIWLEQEVPGTATPYRGVHGYRSWEVETRISHYDRPRTDADGKMRVLFEPGSHRIGVGLEAYPEGYTPVEPDGRVVECVAGEPIAVTFQMKKVAVAGSGEADTYRIQGVCQDENESPLSGVRVRVFRVDNQTISREQVVETETGATGEFDFPELPLPVAGPQGYFSTYYVLAASKTGRASFLRGYLSAEAGTTGLQLRMPPSGSLEGRVTDPDGNPIADAQVFVISYPANLPIEGVFSTTSDADGRYELSDLAPWNADEIEPMPAGSGLFLSSPRCFYTVQHPDYAKFRPVYTKVPSTIDVTLQPAGTIEGRVTDQVTGHPAVGATVSMQMTDESGRKNQGGAWQQVRTDEKGRYQLTSLAAAKYNIWADAPDRTCIALDSLSVGPGETVQDADLTLIEGGWIEGRIIDANSGEPLAHTPEGMALRIGLQGPSRPKSGAAVQFTPVGDDGRFRIRAAPGMNYPYIMGGLWQRAERRADFERGIEVAPGQTTSAEFRILDHITPPYRASVALPVPVPEELEAALAVRNLGGWYQLDDERHVIEVNMVFYKTEDGVRYDNPVSNTDEILQWLPSFPRLKRLYLKEGQATDDGLAHVSGLKELEFFFVWDASAVSDAGIEHLRELNRLRNIHVSNSKIGDGTLAVFGTLPALERLSLPGNDFTDDGVRHLVGLRKLRSLWIGMNQTPFTDAVTSHLARLWTLSELDLQSSRLTDAGVRNLDSLRDLSTLYVDGTGSEDGPTITDASLEVFESMGELRRLQINNSRLTAESIGPLARLPYLKSLSMEPAFISAEAIAELKEQYPDRSLNLTRIDESAASP